MIRFSKLYVNLPAYLSPCIVTGDSLCPGLLLISPNNCLYILELTVGFETNLDINSHCKEEKYLPLLKDLNCDYRQVQFVNLSMSCLGIFGQSSDSFLEMCKCIGINQSHLNYISNKISSIIIRTTYYIFARETNLGLTWNFFHINKYLLNNTTCSLFFLTSIFIVVSRCKPAKCKLPFLPRLVFVAFQVVNKRMKF